MGESHAVTIVGWDDNFSRENFPEDFRPKNDGAYLVLNSYGENWGDSGYFWISYEDSSVERRLHGVISVNNITKNITLQQMSIIDINTEEVVQDNKIIRGQNIKIDLDLNVNEILDDVNEVDIKIRDGKSNYTEQVTITGKDIINNRVNVALELETKIFKPGTYVIEIIYAGETIFKQIEINSNTFDFEINEDETSITLTGYNGEDRDINIPRTYLGYNVTRIGENAFYYNDIIESITVYENIISIGEKIISDGVIIYGKTGTTVETYASENEYRFIVIGTDRISGNYWIFNIEDKTLIINGEMYNYSWSTIPWYSFAKNIHKVEINYNTSKIGNTAFYNCSNLTEIRIPSSVTNIGNEAFYGCSNLKTVTFEEESKLMKIGNNSFYKCSSLNAITIPLTVTSIGKSAFYGCYELGGTINLPQVINISENAFYNCYSLEGLSDLLVLQSIGKNAFYRCYKLKAILNLTQVTTIGDNAFGYCSSLSELKFINDSILTTIGEGAFYRCISLKNIEIPSSVKTISKSTFYECSNLTTVTIVSDSKLATIGENAFYKCISLTNMNIPSSVENINKFAFYECSSLTTVIIGSDSKLATIGDYVFSRCVALKNVTFENMSQLTTIGTSAFGDCTSLKELNLENNIQLLTINEGTFVRCSGLEYIKLPDCLEEIGREAFSGCSNLAIIEIPQSVKNIGTLAFSGCNKLTKLVVHINDTNEATKATWGTPMFEETMDNEKIPEGLVMSVRLGSSSQTFAEEKNITYEIMDVAKIEKTEGETTTTYGYLTIEEALNNVEDNTQTTITLLENKTVTEDINVGTNKDVTLDLNKSSIVGNITNEGTLLLTNGIVNGTVTNIGTLTVGENLNDTITIKGTPIAINNTGTLNIPNGCSLQTETEGEYEIVTLKNEAWDISADDGKSQVYAILSEDETTLTITGIGDMKGWDLYGNSPGWNEHKDSITTLTIEQGVTNIGCYAFSGSSNLTQVEIPSGVTSIGNAAFYNCSKLQNVVIPESVTHIGEETFYSCTALKNIEMSNSITFMGQGAFCACSSLENIDIPTELTQIAEYTFQGCSSLKEIVIPDEVTVIGMNAFYNCSVLNTVTLTEDSKLWSIGSEAFGYTGITSINIPSEVTGITASMFVGCSNLKTITFEEESKLTIIDMSAFANCTNLESIEIPEGVTTIEKWAFGGCTNLKTVTIYNKGAIEFGEDVFFSCKENLTLLVRLGSSAQKYAEEKNITYEIMDVAKIEKKEGEITSTYGYLTIEEALNDVEENSQTIITLLENKTVTENINIGANKDVIIDLNKSSITGDITIEGNLLLSSGTVNGSVTNNGILTIGKNLEDTVIIVGEAYGIENTDTLTINGGIIKGKKGAINSSINTGVISTPTGYYLKRTTKGDYEVATLSNTYTVTLNTNGGIINSGNITEYEYGTGATLPTDVTRKGYTFEGWFENSDFSGEVVTAIGTGETGDKTFYAKWEANTDTPYKVEHYKESLDGTYTLEETDELTGTTNTEVTVQSKTYEGFEENTTHENRVASGTIASDGSLVLKLYYDREQYSLIIEKGSNIAEVTGSGTYKYGQEVEITATLENISGYEYENFRWETEKEAVLDSKVEKTTKVTIPSKDIEITAKADRKAIVYKISYELNGGSLEKGKTNPTTYTVETEDITLNNPSKKGYTFEGWKLTKLNGENQAETEDILYPTVKIARGNIGDREYTAQWKKAKLCVNSKRYTLIKDKDISYIEGIKANTTVNEVKKELIESGTNGNISIFDGDTELSNDKKLATGMIMVVNLNDELISCKIVVAGDITGDGNVDNLDLLMLARYIVGFEYERQTVVNERLRATDILKDNSFATNIDLLKLARILVSLDNY